MNVAKTGPYLFCLCAAAGLTSGCGGSAPVPEAPSFGPPHAAGASRGTSWMDPEARRGDLLYVADTETSDVYVFSYPKGRLEGTIAGLSVPAGECVDAAGDVFVANTGASNVLEFAHGGTSPIATLKDPGFFPIGCSVDPVTGNLAVTNFSTTGSAQGDVVIYKHAKGSPTGHFADPSMFGPLLCGYDGSGNLFVDGLTRASAFVFDELRPHGRLKSVALDQNIQSAGGVQWDGTYVAVGDQATNTIYRFAISGRTGTLVGSTPLGGAGEVFQFWIEGPNVVGPDAENADVGIWKYPAGGAARKTIPGFYVPLGAAVSKAK